MARFEIAKLENEVETRFQGVRLFQHRFLLPRQREIQGVSHLLHMAFLPGLCGLLCHPCFVNPAMENPSRLLSQCAVLPAGHRSCSWPRCEAIWPWAQRAAILSTAYPVARLWGR